MCDQFGDMCGQIVDIVGCLQVLIFDFDQQGYVVCDEGQYICKCWYGFIGVYDVQYGNGVYVKCVDQFIGFGQVWQFVIVKYDGCVIGSCLNVVFDVIVCSNSGVKGCYVVFWYVIGMQFVMGDGQVQEIGMQVYYVILKMVFILMVILCGKVGVDMVVWVWWLWLLNILIIRFEQLLIILG